MTRLMLARSLATVGLALTLTSCSATDTSGSFTLSLSDPSLSLGQGVQDTVTITVTRTRYSKPVTLAFAGVPNGVTAALSPRILQSPSQTSLLVLNASGTASLGAATISVQATGEGVADKTTTLDLTVGVTGNFSLGSQGAPAVAAQGGAASAIILLARSGGHADNVALAVTGAPAGVIASISPTATTGGAASLTITADATTAVGTYPLQITGVAPGLPNQTTSVSLSVIAPPSTATLTMPFCANSVPNWFAYQNEGYGWQVLSPVGSTFTIPATTRIALAYTYVLQSTGTNETDFNLIYADRSELASQSDRDCDGPKAVSGSVVGATTGQSVRVAMGAKVATATAATPTFALASVYDRALDLIATKGAISSTSGNLLITPDMVLVRRNQTPANNATLPALDFGATEAFAPSSNTITIGNGIAFDQFRISNTFWTGTNTYGTISATQPTTSSTVYSVPAAKLQPGDMHEMVVESNQPSFFSGRVNVTYVGALTDRTETLPPVLSSPTLSTLTTAPYVRLRGQLPAQAEYPAATRFIYFQDGAGTGPHRLLYIVLTKGYLGATPASTWDVVTPDFGVLFGFNNSWMLSTPSIVFQAEAYAGPGPVLFGAVPTVGDVVKVAYRVQSNSTLLRANASLFPSRAQYLRR